MDRSLLRDIRNGRTQRNSNKRVSSRRRKRKPRERRDYRHIPTSVLDQFVTPSFYQELQEDFGKLDFKECVLKAEQLGLRIYICGRNDIGKPIYTFGHSYGFSPVDSYQYVTKDLENRQIIATCNDSETLQNLEFDPSSWGRKEKMFYFNRGKYHIVKYLNRSRYDIPTDTYLCQGRTFMDRETELMLENILYEVFDDQYWTVQHILEYCMETKRHALVVHQYNHVTFLVEAPLEECVRIENGKERKARPVGQNVTVVMTRASKFLDRWTEEMQDRDWDAKKMKKLMENENSVHDAILASKTSRDSEVKEDGVPIATGGPPMPGSGGPPMPGNLIGGGPPMPSGGPPMPGNLMGGGPPMPGSGGPPMPGSLMGGPPMPGMGGPPGMGRST